MLPVHPALYGSRSFCVLPVIESKMLLPWYLVHNMWVHCNIVHFQGLLEVDRVFRDLTWTFEQIDLFLYYMLNLKTTVKNKMKYVFELSSCGINPLFVVRKER